MKSAFVHGLTNHFPFSIPPTNPCLLCRLNGNGQRASGFWLEASLRIRQALTHISHFTGGKELCKNYSYIMLV